MHVQETKLKPLSALQLTAEETTIVKWLRNVAWETVPAAHGATALKAKVPEFYGGTRLYRMQAGGPSSSSLGALETFIRKLSLLGIISKQELYPVLGHGNQPRYVSLKKPDLENLGVGKSPEDDED